jgi:hypothetical protein
MKKGIVIILGAVSAILLVVFCLSTVGLFVFMAGHVGPSPATTDREYRRCCSDVLAQVNQVDSEMAIALELEQDLLLFCGEVPRWATIISAQRSAHHRCPVPDTEHLRSAKLHIDLVLLELAQSVDYWDGFCLSYSLAGESMLRSDIELMEQAAEHMVNAYDWVEKANEALNEYESSE